MTIVLHDPTDNTYYTVDQINGLASRSWENTIDKALASMRSDEVSDNYYSMTIDQYREKYTSYEIWPLDTAPQPYEYW